MCQNIRNCIHHIYNPRPWLQLSNSTLHDAVQHQTKLYCVFYAGEDCDLSYTRWMLSRGNIPISSEYRHSRNGYKRTGIKDIQSNLSPNKFCLQPRASAGTLIRPMYAKEAA